MLWLFYFHSMQLKPEFYKKAIWLSLCFFLVSICLGLFLRLSQVWTITGFNYKHLLHGHSHITLLGWVYNSFFIAIVRYIVPKTKRTKGYGRIFWLTQLTIFASLISFPLQGYGVLSIVFSTLFIICSYCFCYRVLRDLKNEQSIAAKFIRWAIYYLILSSIGPWSLGAIMNLGLKDTDWYPLSIYFYLHFFYNGFFVFSIFGLLFRELNKVDIQFNYQKASKIFFWLNITCAPSFLLSVLWTEPSMWAYLIAFLASLMQLWACVLLFHFLKPYLSHFKNKMKGMVYTILAISTIALYLKVILQVVSAVPWMAEMIYAIKSYLVIGYIHLVMLGFVSCFLLGYLIFKNVLKLDQMGKLGLGLFILGLIGSELLLFGQGTLQVFQLGMIKQLYTFLFIISACMPIGILIFFSRQRISR